MRLNFPNPVPLRRKHYGIGLCECLVCLLLFSLLALNITGLTKSSLQTYSILKNQMAAAWLAAELGTRELRGSSEIARLTERVAAELPAGQLHVIASGSDLRVRIAWSEPGTTGESQYELLVHGD